MTGTPAQGFRIASVAADPLVVSVEGDADQLAALMSADTAPVSVSGATRDVSVQVALALPSGVIAVGARRRSSVSVHVEALTETRTYSAGHPSRRPRARPRLRRVGVAGAADPVRAGGRPRPLWDSAPIVVGVNVAGLAPGSHELPVVPSLPSTLTLVEVSPETVIVTIAVPATQAPAASGDVQSPAAPDGGAASPAP